jgi:hypothetical protein
MSRFTCEFENESGDDRVIVIDLPAHEIEAARGREIVAMAYALQRAYAMVAPDFRHRSVTPVSVN